MSRNVRNLSVGLIVMLVVIAMRGFMTASAVDPSPSPTATTAPTTPPISRTLYVDFMGRDSPVATASPGKAKLTQDDVNHEFWVGVAVDNVGDLNLFRNGLYSLEIAFEYDPTYIEPYYKSGSTNAAQDWLDEIIAGNLSSQNDDLFWDSSQYEIQASVRRTDIDTVNDREDKNLMTTRQSSGWKMCTVSIRFKKTATFANARFQGMSQTDGTKKYLIKLPFRVNSVPGDAVIPKPQALSLVRGPETLNIGSGANGKTPYSQWTATVTDWSDQTNMKTLFEDKSSISLFDAGADITDMVLVSPEKTPNPQSTASPMPTTRPKKEHQLSVSPSMPPDNSGFRTETTDYWVTVENDESPVKLEFESSEQPTVKVNGVNVNVSSIIGGYETDLFNLVELDKTLEPNGWNNTALVTVGSTTYTIHIRRLLKPKIVLEYGNSPYGEIMRAANIPDADKQTAKDKFNSTNMYNASYLPTGCTITNRYLPKAWGGSTDPAVNMDRNDYALFIYQKQPFKDPGFTAYDSMGNEYKNDVSLVSRKLKLYRMATSDLTVLADPNGETIQITEPVDTSITKVTGKDENGTQTKLIRLGVYDMTYSFLDTTTNEQITEIRKVVLLTNLGDVNLDCIVNSSDGTLVKNDYQKTKRLTKTGLDTDIANLLLYKIADVNCDGTINSSDGTLIKNHYQKTRLMSALYVLR